MPFHSCAPCLVVEVSQGFRVNGEECNCSHIMREESGQFGLKIFMEDLKILSEMYSWVIVVLALL